MTAYFIKECENHIFFRQKVLALGTPFPFLANMATFMLATLLYLFHVCCSWPYVFMKKERFFESDEVLGKKQLATMGFLTHFIHFNPTWWNIKNLFFQWQSIIYPTIAPFIKACAVAFIIVLNDGTGVTLEELAFLSYLVNAWVYRRFKESS